MVHVRSWLVLDCSGDGPIGDGLRSRGVLAPPGDCARNARRGLAARPSGVILTLRFFFRRLVLFLGLVPLNGNCSSPVQALIADELSTSELVLLSKCILCMH